MPDFLDSGIGIAERIGRLSTSAVLALLCLSMGFYIYRKMKLDKVDSENWRKTREDSVRAEERQTEAFHKLVDVTAMNTNTLNVHAGELKEIRFILNERLPQKGEIGGRSGTA